jgi:hypothetical protein
VSGFRGYRPLLSAYPARLRRTYGPELIATLTEMAGPDGRPARSDRVRLVLDGLGERFRPPARRPFGRVVAVLALLIGGALGAAVGSWLGTLAYPALPDAQSFAQRILPAGEGIGASNASHYLSAGQTLRDGTDVGQAVEGSRQKLVAEGWQTTPVWFGGIVSGYGFTATKDGVRLDVGSASDPAQGALSIGFTGRPERPAGYLPLTVAGTLLGLAAGWLIGVALAHRIRASRRPLTKAVLTVTGLVLAIPSAAGFIASLVSYLISDQPTPTGGALVHEQGFAFGPTTETLLSLRLPVLTLESFEGIQRLTGGLQQLWIWGLAVVAVAAVLARRSNKGEKLDAAATS